MMKNKRQRKTAKVRKFPPSEDLSFPNKSPSNKNHSRSLTSRGAHKTAPSRAPIRPIQRQGQLATIRPIVSDAKQKELGQRAVSVHYLQTQFSREVQAVGCSLSSSVSEIENLSGPPGVIRQKGKKQKCPIDGKPGAAYVHCVQGEDNVGKAGYMLSYSWKYSIGDIIATLVDFCESHAKNPKRTYVWICCLCVNQHRVVEQSMMEQTGMMETETLDFFSIFGERVFSIGTIIAMMAPWDNPSYLTRVWCIFELYTAHQKGCEIIIAMPPAQTKALELDLFGQDSGNMDRLYEVLANTKVQNAQASVEKDRIAILDIVKVNPGYATLNNRVNELLRGWVRGTITQLIAKRERLRAKQESAFWYRFFCCCIHKRRDLLHANFNHYVGVILNNNEEHDAALESANKAKSIRQRLLGERHPDVAISQSLVGRILFSKGDYDAALVEHEKAMEIRESTLGKDHVDTAESHLQLGVVSEAKGEYERALAEHRRALEIRQAKLEEDDVDIAESLGNVASVLDEMGDTDGALEHCRKALKIREASQGSHPDTAALYGILGAQLFKQGDYDGALEQTRKALAIEESILGQNHTDTASSYSNIGLILKTKGDLDGALVENRKALAVFASVLGEDHAYTARSNNNIGSILQCQGKHDEALVAYEKALKVKEASLGPNHPDTATSYNNIGSVLHDKGDYDAALVNHRKALEIRKEVFGEDNYKLVGSYNNIGGALQAKGDFEGALDAFRKSLEISEATQGKNNPEAKDLLNKIYWLLRVTM